MVYPEKAIIQSRGRLLSETSLVKLLDTYQSDEVLLRVGEIPSETTFRVYRDWAQYVDRLQREGHYSLELVVNANQKRLGGLNKLGVLKLSHPVVCVSHRREDFPVERVIDESSIDQSYTRGSNYQITYVIGVRNTSMKMSRKVKPTYLHLL